MSDAKQVRINTLAMELEVSAKAIIDYLPKAGVTEKQTHSSSIDAAAAMKVREHFIAIAKRELEEATTKTKEKLFDHILVVPKSVGLTREMSDLAEKLSKLHGAKSLSEYIRGLILLDAFITEGTAEIRPTNANFPDWMLSQFSPEFLVKAHEEYRTQKKSKLTSSPKSISLEDLKKW